MNNLTQLREQHNLTQEELAEQCGVSVRTIQRIEAGQNPKGYTLKALAGALKVQETAFFDSGPSEEAVPLLKWQKIVNLSALPFVVFPPLNILVPLVIIIFKKQYSAVNRKFLSIQVVWTIIAIVWLVVVLMLHDWLGIASKYTLLIFILWVVMDVVLIIRNAVALSQSSDPHIWPDMRLF